jgi:hypothetical protein
MTKKNQRTIYVGEEGPGSRTFRIFDPDLRSGKSYYHTRTFSFTKWTLLSLLSILKKIKINGAKLLPLTSPKIQEIFWKNWRKISKNLISSKIQETLQLSYRIVTWVLVMVLNWNLKLERTDLETGPAVNLVLIPTQRGSNDNLRFSGKRTGTRTGPFFAEWVFAFCARACFFFSFSFFCFVFVLILPLMILLLLSVAAVVRLLTLVSFSWTFPLLHVFSDYSSVFFSSSFFLVGFVLPVVAAMGGEHVKQSRGENLILTSAFCGRSDSSLINNRLEEEE